MEKIRALFMCDKQLGERTKQIAEKRGDVEVVIKEITHLDIDKLALEIDQNRYDVFLSRGESCASLARQFDLPVIDIPVSDYDMLRILKTVSTYQGKKAIVSHYSLLGDAQALCELMQYKIEIFSVSSSAEAAEVLKRLQERQYSLIIGGYTIVRVAKQLGMNGIVIQSGDASINQGLERAVNIVRQVRKLSQRVVMCETVIQQSRQYTIVFHKNGKQIYSSIPFCEQHYDYVMDTLHSLMQEAVLNSEATYYQEQEMLCWVFRSVSVRDGYGRELVIFYVRSLPKPEGLLDYALTVRGTGEYTEPFFNPFDGVSSNIQKLMRDVELFGRSDCSVLIIGNDGTGKELLAEMIHMHSRHRNEIVAKIDCELTDCQQLELIFQEDFVFKLAAKGTIILSNIHALDIESQRKLCQVLSSGGKLRNFRLITTSRYDLLAYTQKNQFVYKLYKKISELQIIMPVLSERAEDIESLSSVLIGIYNQEHASGVIGFEKKAVERLKQFPWDSDIEQLKRVIRTLVLETEGPYISAEKLEAVLELEQKRAMFQDSIGRKVDFSGTLDEIMNQVVKAVMEEEGMNQSRAAKRLGISRSTMWRRLR